ncbi:MAG: PIG-L family deacetylase [Acidobacteria bacterium]|nr:PIG-L family deacetylase [Acidobacteriota bacterium]
MKNLMTIVAVLMGLAAFSASSRAQTGLDLVDVDLMFVGAHPDDDTFVMATFARYLLDQGFRASVITATGGEGGGNATGPESGIALGLIRAEEERRALEVVGVRTSHFLSLQDFYFTLSAEETARKWGDSYVCDVVRYVRLERPEVIVTMWPGPGTHGQHQMAARAATIAFDKAADPNFCPELITEEHLEPFQPLKLYYSGQANSPTTLSIDSDDYSPAANMRYADLKALASSKYRSQGFDQRVKIPVEEARPESFMLVRSMVPLSYPERHLLEGALLPAGTSPPGIRLEIVPESFETGIGVDVNIEVTLVNNTAQPLEMLEISLEPGEGWSVAEEGLNTFDRLEPGGRAQATFQVRASEGATIDRNTQLYASYRARQQGRAIAGRNTMWLKAVAPVQVRFRPTFDVAGYREFARDTHTDWVIESLPTRLPLTIGRSNPVTIDVINRGPEAVAGEVQLRLDPSQKGIRVRGDLGFNVAARSSASVQFELEVTSEVLPQNRQSARFPVELEIASGDHRSLDAAQVYVLPMLQIPRLRQAPIVDGDLSDMRGFAGGVITHKDLWWRQEPRDDSDSSASFHIAYDGENIYVGVDVRDDTVVCNIAPNDVRAQLRSDAVGITIDPSGRSRDTSTVIQAAAFPCTTEGFQARGFRDADANQGVMEKTAPGMKVASRKTDTGYTLEFSIPWRVLPAQPQPGDEMGMNIVIYDGDQKDARVGANISESGLAWAAFQWGGKQAIPYLWPRVVLGR